MGLRPPILRSGWIVDADERLIVTNQHVIEGAEACEIYIPEFIDGRLNTDPATLLDSSRAFKPAFSTATKRPHSASNDCAATVTVNIVLCEERNPPEGDL